MKKVLGILAVSVALVGFTACGGDDSANETGTAAGILAAQLEEKGAAEGYAIDVDCAIKKLVTLSVEDLTLMSENIDFEGDDLTEFGASEKANTVVGQIAEDCISASEEATDETSEDMTEETTP